MQDTDSVLRFWFEELTPKQWFAKDPDLDLLISQRFKDLHTSVSQAELYAWRKTPLGRLAEIIVLDQFSRNIYRDQPQAFGQDPMALALAQEAIAQSADQPLPIAQRAFMYMPYMHSESKMIHTEAVRLFDQPGLELNLNFELKHKEIIDRFGRYPHRNVILGRISTKEESRFLLEPGSGF